uniref:DUF4806 domain-containing protein n=1 Tax=Elaeophora elaphi TaxID=1147741 RepID=A0A0R3RKI9_9BILA
MAGRLKSQWKKLLPDTVSSDQQQQQQQDWTQDSSTSSSSSTTSASPSASSLVTVMASTPGSDSFGLKATKEKLKNIGLPSNFRKLRKKFLRHKKEGIGSKEENTEFEKVAVQQRPAKSKKKKQNVLKWKEGVKPSPVSVGESKEKKKYQPKKKKRLERKKKKLKLVKSFTAEPITETEKEQKTIEKEEVETEVDTEEQAFTEAKEEDSEFESMIDRKKKEIPSTSSVGGTSDTSVSSKTPSESSLVPPQIPQEPTPVHPTIKDSEESIAPSQESAPLAKAGAASTSSMSSTSALQKSDTSSTTLGFDMFDSEPIILSTPACQVLGIIMNKQFFKNAAASETENELIRLYFAGKIPPGREKDAQRTLEKAVSLAVTRVKSSGLSDDLYNFLNNNRLMAISLMIDAMKYRKKDFLPEFWTYDRMNKREPPPEPPF